jgi:hypothetical protein
MKNEEVFLYWKIQNSEMHTGDDDDEGGKKKVFISSTHIRKAF